jgi:hypothetical protein
MQYLIGSVTVSNYQVTRQKTISTQKRKPGSETWDCFTPGTFNRLINNKFIENNKTTSKKVVSIVYANVVYDQIL